jgi:hypothetical protein
MFPLRQDCTFRVNHPRIRIIPNAETAGKHLASAVAAREKEVDPMPETEQTTTFPSGAIRSRDADRTRFDLIPPRAWHRLAETCAEGARKYGDRNWERGFPASSLLNHAFRHLNLWLCGDATEDHLAHAIWNLMAIMHFEHERPDLMDVPSRQNHDTVQAT